MFGYLSIFRWKGAQECSPEAMVFMNILSPQTQDECPRYGILYNQNLPAVVKDVTTMKSN